MTEEERDEHDRQHKRAMFWIDVAAFGTVSIVVCAPIVGLLWLFGVFDEERDSPPASANVVTQEKEQKSYEERQFEKCTEYMNDRVARSCAEDPEFAYCGLNYERHEILGSGCTSAVKSRGSYAAQVDFCKSESLKSVTRGCLIEVYGCAGVTGNINC